MTASSQSAASILVINCGSSSIKFAVIPLASLSTSVPDADAPARVHGIAEQLGSAEAHITLHWNEQKHSAEIEKENANHKQALTHIFTMLEQADPDTQLAQHIRAIGHRVVHGGEAFTQATALTPAVIAEIERHNALAPLHNPANLQGIAAAQELFPQISQVAVFDTAFHQTMPEKAWRYALPAEWYTEHGIRRYGFHGSSHAYVSQRADALENERIGTTHHGWITAHLGNGCSAAAVFNGKSVDTTMGLTPLEGLVMGTRCGSIDPGLHSHLCRTLDIGVDDLDTLLNKKSGLLGLSQLSNDMRTLQAEADAGNSSAVLAIEVFCYQAAKHIAALTCALPVFNGVVFTGGIGEHAPAIRQSIVAHLRHLHLTIDPKCNQAATDGAPHCITNSVHTVPHPPVVWVIPTDEERYIAQQTLNALQ